MNIINDFYKISFFGESHSKMMGLTIDNLDSGIKLDLAEIKDNLTLRRGNDLTTPRKEEDDFEIVSGFFNGFTTGASLTVIIKNKDYDDSVYNEGIFRPSTSDYVAYKKYHGFNDFNGSGMFSGRLTALYVIAGTIMKQVLANTNILVSSHIKQVFNFVDQNFDKVKEERDLMLALNKEVSPFIDSYMKDKVTSLINNTFSNYGSSIETKVIGLEGLYLGEPLANSIESKLASLLYMIPGVKAVEFGLGTSYASSTDEANDIYKKTNNEGGVNGGITNDLPLVFTTTFRAVPSTSRTQEFYTKDDTYVKTSTSGRHDRVIALRASVIINSLVYIALADLVKIGGRR